MLIRLVLYNRCGQRFGGQFNKTGDGLLFACGIDPEDMGIAPAVMRTINIFHGNLCLADAAETCDRLSLRQRHASHDSPLIVRCWCQVLIELFEYLITPCEIRVAEIWKIPDGCRKIRRDGSTQGRSAIVEMDRGLITDGLPYDGLLILYQIFPFFLTTHCSVPSLCSSRGQIPELLRDCRVVTDGLAIHGRIILDGIFAQSCLLWIQ